LQAYLANLPIAYHHEGRNVGYGQGHNKAIQECSESRYHVIINPDIILAPTAIRTLTAFMDEHPDVGMVCPKVLNPDGTVQRLNKRYPNVLDLFLRRFLPRSLTPLFKERLDRYEMGDKGYDSIYDVESMTGAFMFCRTDALKLSGAFDPRYFMYFEDTDLSRTFQKLGYRKVYYPHAAVTHLWERAAHKNLWMTLVFIRNMMRYFNKWGWKFY
jgi:GT2 family glycosyltransferase